MSRLSLLDGRLLALVALFGGVASGVALKRIHTMPAGEAIALRSALAFLVITGIAMARPRKTPRITGLPGILRATLDALAALTFSLAIFEIPLSMLASIHATLPVLSVILSGVVLKERLQAGNWLALLLAGTGTLLVIQPELAFSPYGVALALISTLAYACRDLLTRKLPAHTDTLRLSQLSLIMVGVTAAVLSSDQPWICPEAMHVVLITIAALGFVAANVLIIIALRRTELSRIAPLRYSSILWSLIFDALLWDYLPDLAGVCGIALILSAGIIQLQTDSPKAPEVAP
ncbi:DMT family transporter [Granulosicoccus sp. 3-233]|uniref:DMT family transporter n=1 Tax=Granulosicoccus sp. 3-233 TaxID=3417969 RepID=UPI003D338654